MSLVIIGTFNIDTIETPQVRKERIAGGSGTYAALAASFFTQPGIVGVIGEDFPGEILDIFKEKKIDTHGLETRKGKTFFWEGRYGDDPNQRTTLKTEINVLHGYEPRIPVEYKKADIIFLANIDPDLQEDILDQAENPQLVAMDTMNFWINKKPDALLRVLRRVNIFFANDEEVKMLVREANLVAIGRQLLTKGPKLSVIKKGEHGVLILDEKFVCAIPAFPSECVVDPTGAGDCFAGGFLGYLDKVRSCEEADVRRAAVYGTVMASFAIEDFGIDRFRTLTFSEIEERYEAFRKLVSF
ncbi:MAG: sugar kinase [Candidatus Aminicenantes bacterium]|nr:sugar kinase [Candidatus Aminicenantes bacterium]